MLDGLYEKQTKVVDDVVEVRGGDIEQGDVSGENGGRVRRSVDGAGEYFNDSSSEEGR